MGNDGSIGAVSGVSATQKALFESFQPAVQTAQALFSKQVDSAANKVVFGTAVGYGAAGATGVKPTTGVDPAGHARVTPMTPAEKAAVDNDVQSLEGNIGNDAKVLKDPNSTKSEKDLAIADLTTMRKSLTGVMKDPKTPPDAKPIIQGVIDDINATLTLTPTAATSAAGQADYSLQPA